MFFFFLGGGVGGGGVQNIHSRYLLGLFLLYFKFYLGGGGYYNT